MSNIITPTYARKVAMTHLMPYQTGARVEHILLQQTKLMLEEHILTVCSHDLLMCIRAATTSNRDAAERIANPEDRE